MATILPGSPPAFNRRDVALTVKQLCSYSHGMHETLDFQLGQIKRELEVHDGKIKAHDEAIASMQRAILTLQEDVNDLETKYNRLSARVAALEGGTTE